MPAVDDQLLTRNYTLFGSNLGVAVGSWEGGETPQPRSGAGSPPLPCQYSNNSTEPKSKLSSYQRKNAFSINENLNFAVLEFGIEKIGFLTLTFPKKLTLKEANRRFNSLATHVLDELFSAWVCVREFTKAGNPHFHAIVICKEDIREGFDFGNYVKMAHLTSRPERRRKFSDEIRQLSRQLNPSPALSALWKELRRVLPLYQFGRAELIPIRKTAEALARYVGGYIRKSMEFRPLAAKGSRLITYSKGFPRKIVGHQWAFHTPGSELWRRKVALFADLHGIKDMEGLKASFGPRWAWWFKDVIESLNLIPTVKDSCTSHEVLRACMQDLLTQGLPESVLDSGLRHFDWLHVRQPKLPEIDGKSFRPPAELAKAFGFHLNHWRKSRAWHEEFHAEAAEHVSDLASHWDVKIVSEKLREESRALALQSSRKTPASIRSENYTRICHPNYSPA